MAEENEEGKVAVPACPICDTELPVPEGTVSVRCPKCKTHSHVSDLTGERREFLKAKRREAIEAAMAKAASEA